jgi:hypothetical protein
MLVRDDEADLEKTWRDVPITSSAAAYADEDYRLLTLQLYLAHSAQVLALLTEVFKDHEAEQYPLALRKLLSGREHPVRDAPVRREEIAPEFHARLVAEMLVCRIVDNFLAYVAGLLTEIFKHRPEALRSKETVTWEFVLGFEDPVALRNALAEIKVDRLAYAGVAELSKKLDDDLSLVLFEPDELPKIARAVEIRNLVVHNRGVVNERAVKKAPALAPHLGTRLPLGDDSAMEVRELVHRIVRRTDARAIRKFSLPASSGYVHPHIPEE